jgi:hypothetical protein
MSVFRREYKKKVFSLFFANATELGSHGIPGLITVDMVA